MATGLAGAVLVLLSAAVAAQALSCVPPPSDWAQFRVVDLESDRPVARMPFTGHEPGYGCNVGNMHTLGGPWLAWAQTDAQEWVLRVLDMEAVEEALVPVGRERPLAFSVAPPYVLLLEEREDDGFWTVWRVTVDPGRQGAGERTEMLAEGSVLLGGGFVHSLAGDRHSPRLAVLDAAAGRTVQHASPLPTPEGTRGDWQMLAGNGSWLVVASDLPQDRWGPMLPQGAKAWLHRVGEERLHPLQDPGEGSGVQEARFGSFALDGGYVYYEVWDTTLPWFPSQLMRRAVPDGTPERVDGSEGLMRGVAVDGGLLVTGRYLQERPDPAQPWVDAAHWNPTPPSPTPQSPVTEAAPDGAPGPGVWVAAAVLSAALAVRMRRGPQDP